MNKSDIIKFCFAAILSLPHLLVYNMIVHAVYNVIEDEENGSLVEVRKDVSKKKLVDNADYRTKELKSLVTSSKDFLFMRINLGQ